MVRQLVTVAVVPRERFSFSRRSLESILAHTEQPCELVYIDGGSPQPVREYLQRRASERGFQLLRTDHYLSPNAARNLALAKVRTKYVVFIDNDVLVSPNWLPPLVDCAEATGAWVAGPVYCEQEPLATRIHMTGGTAQIVIEDGRRLIRESHRHYGQSLAHIAPTLRREPVEQIEFHCALVRMSAFDCLGPLDEGLLSAVEHTDLCLLARGWGGEVYLEPKSVVTYVPPPPFDAADLSYFRLRWSHAWNEASIARFREKWDLDYNDPGLESMRQWLTGHRQLALERYRRVLRVFGRRPARLMEKILIAPLEAAANRARFPYSTHASSQQVRAA